MPSQPPRRGTYYAALIAVSLASSVVAQTSEPTTREGPPRVTSLDDVRLDRSMTLLNAGETLEPKQSLTDDAPSYVVELPSHKELILDLARRAGRAEPTVRVLPEESRTPDRYGIVTVDHAILRKGARDAPGDRENLSDVTLGEPVWILDASGDKTSLLVHASDGYLGWVDATAVWPVGVDLFKRFESRDLRAKLSDGSERTMNADGLAAILRARDGERLRRAFEDREAKDEHSFFADAAIARARRYLGVSYVWGGKTFDGIDCSGLAQTAFASVKIPLPRDADQQSLVGRLVATRWDPSALLPGDLLFYVSPRRGNVHHVAIYLGGGEYIEAAGADVHVSSMTPGAKNYDGKRAATFGWARRVIE